MPVILLLVCCLVAFSGCGTKQAGLSDASSPDLRAALLKEVDYDEKGLPLFVKTLGKRPVRPNERFAIALFQQDRPFKSYDIVIRRQHADLLVPLKILYRWTGRGFSAGAGAGAGMAEAVLDSADLFNSSKDLRHATGVSLVVPVVLGTMGGFMKGLKEGLHSTYMESEKIILKAQEEIVSFTHYEYNGLGQMRSMTMYDPDTQKPLVQTDFYYEGTGNTPTTTIIKSHPENKVRILGNKQAN